MFRIYWSFNFKVRHINMINFLSSSLMIVLCLQEVTLCCGLTTKFVSIKRLIWAAVTLTNIDIATSIEHLENALAHSKLRNTVQLNAAITGLSPQDHMVTLSIINPHICWGLYHCWTWPQFEAELKYAIHNCNQNALTLPTFRSDFDQQDSKVT